MRPRLSAVLLALGIALLAPAHPRAQAPAPAPAEPAAVRSAFLGVIARQRVPAAPSTAVVTQANGYREERLTVSSEAGERVPLLILTKGEARDRRAVVVALHGTGGDKDSMRSWLEAYADRGFLAVSLDARHHGERAAADAGALDAYQAAMLKAFRSGKGHPYLYDTVWDVMRVVDYLVARADVDATRIGLIGNSKGGTEAYLAAAADERIRVVVPFIGVQSFGWSLRHAAGWEARTWTLRGAVESAAAESREPVTAAFVKRFYDRIAPGLVDRFDGPAMLPLIAPRALLVVNADSDPRSPLGGVREAVRSAERAYAAAGASDKFRFLLEEDAAHEITPAARAASLAWVERWLDPKR